MGTSSCDNYFDFIVILGAFKNNYIGGRYVIK
jgi:hypothetical protein